jgi:hypothetical protein
VPDEYFMLPATRKRLAALSAAGGRVVFGGKPFLVEALRAVGRDVATSPALGDGPSEDFMWLHRRDGAVDRYFVAAGTNGYRGKVTFRAKGRSTVYDPVSGERYLWVNGSELELLPSQSVFVEFGSDAAAQEKLNCTNDIKVAFEPWRLSFTPGWGAPAEAVLASPVSWTEIPGFSAEAKAYCGTVVYETGFNLSDVEKCRRYHLNLGRGETIAKGIVNGREVKTLWCEPYSLDITEYAKEGRNRIKVLVTNTWRNRVIYDLGLPEKDRKTWILYRKGFNPSPSDPFVPAGILGPVELRRCSEGD